MIDVSNLVKTFQTDQGTVRAVDDVSFSLPQGQVLTLLGPSGCGKTTTLRSIAGLETPTAGRIRIAGRDVFDAERRIAVPPNRREIGMVFQSYAIWPQMSVFANVAFPLKVRPRGDRPPAAEIAREVARALDIVQLGAFSDRDSTKLSGGQQQRLALARALIRQPDVLLLDEPLSNLDAKLREHTRFELNALQKRLGLTVIYVTHDQEEALALSDTVAVMKDGRIIQMGPPQEIYERPLSRFVADFVGTTNFLAGTVAAVNGDGYEVDTSQGVIRCISGQALRKGQAVEISIRPENLDVASSRTEDGARNLFPARVTASIFLGQSRHHLLQAGEFRMRAVAHSATALQPGAEIFVAAAPQHCIAVPAEPAQG